jgi:predicted amidohydrolase
MRDLRAAVWQYEPVAGDVRANLKALEHAMEEACCGPLDLFVAPECFATGWHPESAGLATPADGPLVKKLAQVAAQFHKWFVTSLLTTRDGRRHNTLMVFDPDGHVVGTQDKIHLWDKERQTLAPGTQPQAIPTPLANLGGLVCYDVEFPEVSRSLAIQGAEVLVVPSAFYSRQSWDIMTRARALENGVFLVASNQVGGQGQIPHNGQSRIVDPYGTVIAETRGSDNGIAIATLDASLIEKARAWAPFLRDRKLGYQNHPPLPKA